MLVITEETLKIQMAETPEKVYANIENANKLGLQNIYDLDSWRSLVKVAIVGGGPSLKTTIEELKKYKYVFACGSVHDYLVANGVYPTYTVVLDPDPLVVGYLKTPIRSCTYLVASQCCPETFKHLSKFRCKVAKWNAGGPDEHNAKFSSDEFLLGGGCTVGTRTILIAHNMGYDNIDLFGFDSCISGDSCHAYPLNDPAKEIFGEVHEITVGGVPFKAAGYMLAQIVDFKRILTHYGDRIRFEVHGPGALHTLMELAKQEAAKHGEKE